MQHCAYCGDRLLDAHDLCSTCARPQPLGQELSGGGETFEDDGADPRPLSAIARFTNAAEAGYFAHELAEATGARVLTHFDEHFDALSGYWSTRYVLAAAKEEAARVTAALRAMLDDSGGDERVHVGPSAAPVAVRRDAPPTSMDERFAPREESGVNWVPIVLTLTAGSVVFWGIKALNEQAGPRKPVAGVGGLQADLWETLDTSDGPWVQQEANGGRRELRIDRRRNVAVIREDADGDGVFERRIQFHREFHRDER
ncbi:MAG: hypothetical protein ACREJB_19190 [Planctomycetaceae bacterium]